MDAIKKATNYDATRKLIEEYDVSMRPGQQGMPNTGTPTPKRGQGQTPSPQTPPNQIGKAAAGTPRAPGHLVGAGGTPMIGTLIFSVHIDTG